VTQTLRIGTRGSALALAQTQLALDALHNAHGAIAAEVVIVRTEGDRDAASALRDIGGRGVFVRDIERALIASTIDIAIHSFKDMPTEQPDALSIGAVLPREKPYDALVCRGYGLDGLHAGARVGTSSPRRAAFLRNRRSDLQIVDIRGNVDTRLSRLDTGEIDALVLACAGLMRLNLHDRICETLDSAWMTPAPGQGVIALQCRADDAVTRALLNRIDDPDTRLATTVERAFLAALGGDCRLPAGAFAIVDNRGGLQLEAALASADGARVERLLRSAPAADAAALGADAARALRNSIERGEA
jgi:hydroxymethylbilane synthase